MHILGSQFMEKLETVGYSGVSRWYTKLSLECSCNGGCTKCCIKCACALPMCCYRRDAVTNVPESHKCDSMHHATKPLSPNPVYSASHLHNAQKQQHPPVNPMLNCPPVNQMLHYCGKVYEFKSTRHVY